MRRQVLTAAEHLLAPGLSTLQYYQSVKRRLDAVLAGGFWHHLGHGIGLTVHEPPYFNPEWDQHLAAGDVVTVEPGLYADELQAGLRLEHDYVITETRAERITHAPLEMER